MASKKTNQDKVSNEDANSRRDFIKKSGLFTALAFTPPSLVMASENKWDEKIAEYLETVPLSIEVNGKKHNLNIEPRTTLLDLLREQLQLTGTKKGCDHGQCGACTVHINGTRVLSCLTLASMQQNAQVTTIEGLSKGKNCTLCKKLLSKMMAFNAVIVRLGKSCLELRV
ncbi:(2Fe-2S)-binding protein [Flavobacterium sp. P21]|uniref:(2Fe-2S)-binding protein n=1 Tax=Flavobacterium sp. P21 TaxID=3423948 RepID=UPI003D67EFFE